VNVDLFKGLAYIGYGERDHTVVWNSWCSHACFSVACLEASIKGISPVWGSRVVLLLAAPHVCFNIEEYLTFSCNKEFRHQVEDSVRSLWSVSPEERKERVGTVRG
jgi:hypothetical protein